MATSLTIVATPIGNVRDISLRAVDELKKADVILAEDTRHTMRLIQALDLQLKQSCRMVSCNSHTEQQRISVVKERLHANHNVVLVSDAGCPTVSDPGSLLVQGVIKEGLSVTVVPGPSAHSAALMGAGIDTTRFAFLGFLPQKKSQRERMITAAANAELSLVIYESPRRIEALLCELHQILGEQRVVVARELTKLYETFHRGMLGQALEPPLNDRGEFVVVVETKNFSAPPAAEKDEDAIEHFVQQQIDAGLSAKDITKLVVKDFSIKKSAAYDLVNKIKKDAG